MVRDGPEEHVTAGERHRTVLVGWKVDADAEFGATAETIEFVDHRIVTVDGEPYGVYDLLLEDRAIDEPWRYEAVHPEGVTRERTDTVGAVWYDEPLFGDRETIHESREYIETER